MIKINTKEISAIHKGDSTKSGGGSGIGKVMYGTKQVWPNPNLSNPREFIISLTGYAPGSMGNMAGISFYNVGSYGGSSLSYPLAYHRPSVGSWSHHLFNQLLNKSFYYYQYQFLPFNSNYPVQTRSTHNSIKLSQYKYRIYLSDSTNNSYFEIELLELDGTFYYAPFINGSGKETDTSYAWSWDSLFTLNSTTPIYASSGYPFWTYVSPIKNPKKMLLKLSFAPDFFTSTPSKLTSNNCNLFCLFPYLYIPPSSLAKSYNDDGRPPGELNANLWKEGGVCAWKNVKIYSKYEDPKYLMFNYDMNVESPPSFIGYCGAADPDSKTQILENKYLHQWFAWRGYK